MIDSKVIDSSLIDSSLIEGSVVASRLRDSLDHTAAPTADFDPLSAGQAVPVGAISATTAAPALSAQALDAHVRMLRRRDSSWIGRAAELKKKMDQDHGDLDNQLQTLADLLYTLPVAANPLAPFVDKSLFVEDSLLDAAVKQAQAEAVRVAEETGKAGRLPQR